MVTFRILLTSAVLVGSAAQADPVTRTAAAFERWLAETGAQGVLAFVQGDDAPVVSWYGLDPAMPVELASLSKAITGVCAAELVRGGVLGWEDRFDRVMGDGPEITFGELITQSGGLREDSTQRLMRRSFGAPWHEVAEEVPGKIAERDGPKGPPGVHLYSNENYALAELMIEAASGRAYPEVCAEVALAPAGVTAAVSENTGAFAAWGGWQMRVGDYARWHHHWFAGEGPIAQAPLSLPHAPVEDGTVRYGMGTYFRTPESGNTFWHFGAVCFPGRMNAGSYAVSLFGEWTLVAAYDACIDWDEMIALDQAVVGALFSTAQ